jgi:hypothetical protein
MLKIKFLLVAVLILSGLMFAQNLWTNEVPINFTIQANTKAASFVDANGVHIVYYKNGGIKYALVNSQGAVIKYDKVIEAEGQGTDFANVAVAGNNVFAVYYKNNNLQIARSTNLGDTWTNTFSNWPMTNTGCNKVIAYSDGENIHITWAELRVGSTYYQDAHYIKFKPATVPLPTWSDYKNVSDLNTDGGEDPDLTLSTGKVHVNFTSFNQPKNRDRISSGSWNNPEDIPYNQFPYSNQVKDLKPLIVGNQLNTVYKSAWNGWDVSGVIISHSYKYVDGTNWTQNQSYLETDRIDTYTLYPHVASNTIDGKIHLIYWDKNQAKYSYRTLIGSTFSNHIAEIPIYNLSTSLNSNSNDLYLIRVGNTSTPGNIYFRQYDAIPLAPQNLTVEWYNGHPKLTWSTNGEADMNTYKIWKYAAGSSMIAATITHNASYTTHSWIDNSVSYPGKFDPHIEYFYKVKALDISNNESDYSSQVSIIGNGGLWKNGDQNVEKGNAINEYKLFSNYPNPFNPSTKISYSIKEEGLVTLKVYDVLGKEVAKLVNENKPEGIYEVEFNASNLPSGMYVYKLQAGNFTDVKKMLLTK